MIDSCWFKQSIRSAFCPYLANLDFLFWHRQQQELYAVSCSGTEFWEVPYSECWLLQLCSSGGYLCKALAKGRVLTGLTSRRECGDLGITEPKAASNQWLKICSKRGSLYRRGIQSFLTCTALRLAVFLPLRSWRRWSSRFRVCVGCFLWRLVYWWVIVHNWQLFKKKTSEGLSAQMRSQTWHWEGMLVACSNIMRTSGFHRLVTLVASWTPLLHLLPLP